MISASTNEMSATFAQQHSGEANSVTASAQATNDLMSVQGQTQKSECATGKSALPPIVLQNSFLSCAELGF